MKLSYKNVQEMKKRMAEKFAKAHAKAIEFITMFGMVLHVTMHGGKLQGIQSVSTLSVCNPYCIARMADGDSVCSHCYVQGHNYKTSLMAHLIANFIRLTKSILPDDCLPIITSVFGRIESFGDVYNVIQARNYIRLIRKNACVKFAIWSKNDAIWQKAFEIDGKPENCTFVLSSDKVNVPAIPREQMKKYIDYIFTVYDFDFVVKHDIKINCGLRKCMECKHCYVRGNAISVNEILKSDAKKYVAWLANK